MYMLPLCLAAWQYAHTKPAAINAPRYSYTVAVLFPATAEDLSSKQYGPTLPDRSKLTKCNAENMVSH